MAEKFGSSDVNYTDQSSTFSLDSDNFFVRYGEVLGVGQIEIMKTDKLHEHTLTSNDWTTVKTIPVPYWEVIELFNTTLEDVDMIALAKELATHPWLINRQGCVYLLSNNKYFKINHVFDWSKYKVDPSRQTVWNKVEINKQELEEKEKELSSLKKELEEMKILLSINYQGHLEDNKKDRDVYTV